MNDVEAVPQMGDEHQIPLQVDDDQSPHQRIPHQNDALIGPDVVSTPKQSTFSGPPPKVATKSLKTWPIAIWFIMSSEFCERFSFYGLKTILAPYLKNYLKFHEDTATLIIHLFIFGAYLLAILGGVVSDTWLGKFKTIIVMSLVYIVGSAVLSVSALPSLFKHASALCLLSLFLIGLGTGGIKPNISSFVGDQFDPTSTEAIASVFAVFYFLINAGSLCSTILTPIIRANVNYAVAFGLPAVLLLVATVLFALGSRGYTKYHISEGPSVFTLFYRVIKTAYSEKKKAKMGNFEVVVESPTNTSPHQSIGEFNPKTPFLDYAKPIMGAQIVDDVKTVLKVLFVFMPLPVFWSLYDQHSSKWVFMAQDMDSSLGKVTFLPEQVQVLNPFLTLAMIPVFDRLIYPFFKNRGIFLHPLKHKMVAGMILTALSFVVSGGLQLYMDSVRPDKVSTFWMIPQFWIMSCAEVLVSITGLEFAYSQAPKWLKSIVMSGWLFTTAVGNGFVALLALVKIGNRALEFFLYAALMILFTMIFYLMVRGYQMITTAAASEEEKASEPLISQQQ